MKKLLYYCVGMLVMATYSCRPNQAERYQRYLEEVNDSNSNFEYITPHADSVKINEDEETIVEKGDWADDDGLVAVPDIPKERKVNMTGGNYDPMKEFSR